MSLPFTLHSLAEGDVVSAWDWYEQQLQGLGDRFVTAVGAAIESACRWPNTGTPAVYDDSGDVVERRVAQRHSGGQSLPTAFPITPRNWRK